MQKVKIFKTVESEVTELEKDINAWLEETGAQIVHISGNIAPQTPSASSKPMAIGGTHFSSSDVLVVIVYETAGA